MRLIPVTACALLAFATLAVTPALADGDDDGPRAAVPTRRALNAEEDLGRLLFFDTSLSSPPGQACVTCHDPAVAFADPEPGLPVSRGAVHGRYGNRNDQPAAYAMFAPPLHFEEEEGIWEGGLFWDGRVNTLEEQAMGPPLNPLEMANADTLGIADKLRAVPYADRFEAVYGPGVLDADGDAFRAMASAVAAFQRTHRFAPFDSKFDRYLAGEVELTAQELRGLKLFEAEDKGNCAACHPTTGDDGLPPLFTDFTYDNLGVPRNPANPFYTLGEDLNPAGAAWVDVGLAQTVDDPAEIGKFRVPTLRNVALTAPYMHNGVFNTLFEVVAFYNSRDVAPWPEPEVAANVNTEELGDLGLTNGEMEDIVAFMRTLSDGYAPPPAE
jgi:cytochrome c peroxidase